MSSFESFVRLFKKKVEFNFNQNLKRSGGARENDSINETKKGFSEFNKEEYAKLEGSFFWLKENVEHWKKLECWRLFSKIYGLG
jgi:hypothetical protein